MVSLGIGLALSVPLCAEDPQNSLILQPAEAGQIGQGATPAETRRAHNKLTLGVNYIGAQLRWNISSRWALETRYQQGKSSSNYGEVTARVFGMRGYRFLQGGKRFSLYGGTEIAFATATPETSDYKTQGVAFGGFGGIELRLAHRFSLATDIGPYVISLRESQSHASSTTLDFILNTALLWKIF